MLSATTKNHHQGFRAKSLQPRAIKDRQTVLELLKALGSVYFTDRRKNSIGAVA